MKQLCITELLSTEVLSVPPETAIEKAVQMMQETAHSCVIVERLGRPVGILTERDMVRILSDLLDSPSCKKLTVSECMTLNPLCIHKDATLYEALVVSRSRGVRHLPVIDGDEKLVGILTQADIANAHFKAIELQREAMEQQIVNRTHELEEANEELKALTLQDALMGIGNRRAMEVDVQYTHQNALRYQRPYSIALMDVDYFKNYNDCYGHRAGDEALVKTAEVIQASIRASDRLYRYGGEELLVLMPETSLDESLNVIKRALANLEAAAIPHLKSPVGILTISAGVCDLATASRLKGNDDIEWKQLVEEADKCLYRAKSQGRNRLCKPENEPE